MEILCMMDVPLEKESSKRRKDVSVAGFNGVVTKLDRTEDVAEHIEQSAQHGAKYVVIPPVICDVETKTEIEREKSFYVSLAPVAKACGVKILISNCFKYYNGHLIQGTFSDPLTLLQFTDELNNSVSENIFGVCADTGVCNICRQNPHEFVTALGDKLSAVVFRTNDGLTDSSLVPFMGVGLSGDVFEWQEMIRGLRNIAFCGPVIMDYRSQACRISHLIRGQVDVLAKKIADYFVWQIELEKVIGSHSQRVLFGAGNMCRNYMKCYGEKYPPRFTCDNNSSLWGTSFEGLEVKNPEELKNIPEDCAILICNVYYREIEQQLRNMGIKNPIEYFNDEYLPFNN